VRRVDEIGGQAPGTKPGGPQRVEATRSESQHPHGSDRRPSIGQLAVDASPRRVKARVLIGIRDVGFHQEVLSFLERDARLDVLGSVTEPGDLIRHLALADADVTVLCPVMGRELSHPATARRARSVLLVAEEMTVPVLREAIDAGAQGVFAWPEERLDLVEAIARASRSHPESPSSRGRVIAVCGARGGAGATFLATHLAAIMADGGERTVVVDVDEQWADLTVALGASNTHEVRTISALVDVVDELDPDHLEDVLYHHPRGFSALLGPTGEVGASAVPEGLYPACIALLAGSFDVVVALVPRVPDSLARALFGMADDVLLVVTLDLFALYGAKRAMASLGLHEPPGRCRVVINRAMRSEVTLADVERILGLKPSAIVRFDPAVRRAQDRGQLLPPRARRVGRDVAALARSLVPARDGARRARA
jgi:pilus assembly protein CpaE